MIKPFLRWAGGKTNLLKHLLSNLPADFSSRKYIEPFVGAGSLFFATNQKESIISDLNNDLINCYLQIKYNPKELYDHLSEVIINHSEDNYYVVRNLFNNKEGLDIEKAAQFIYLNKTSFNGIYRVNQKGEYNVPFGKIKKPSIINYSELLKISNHLDNSVILNKSFTELATFANDSSFYYLDPPYPPINGTSFFTHYTKERFDNNDQIIVRDFAKNLSKLKSKVLISNADIPFIRELYKDWNLQQVNTRRWVSSKKRKYKINELLIRNY